MPSSHQFPPCIIKVPVEFYFEIYNKRFPTHPLYPFILDSEILERYEDTNELKMKRSIKLDIDAPGWFKSLTGLHCCVFIEDTIYEKQKRKITFMTVNETFSRKAILRDLTTYEAHPDNPNWTLFTQVGTVELVVSTLGFNKKIEHFFLELYSRRYDESRQLDEKMIAYCIEEQKAKEIQNQENGVKTGEDKTEDIILRTGVQITV